MTDTTKTRIELASMAADELGLTGPGQSVEAEDQQYIDARFDGLMGELSGRGIVSISDEDAIPIEWCGPLAELLANECARKFGKQKMAYLMKTEIEDRLQVMVNRVGLENVKLKLDPALTGGSGPLTIARWTRGG
jgi:hypothetical protein